MKYILRWFTALVILSVMASCSSTDELPSVAEQEEPTFVLRLKFDKGLMPQRSTGNPMGGEIGDGLKAGLHHENDIKNICLFKFNAGVNAINGDANTPVEKLIFINNINFSPSTTESDKDIIKKDIPLTEVEYEYTEGDKFIVAVNMGNIMGNTTTLGALRNHLVEHAWNDKGSEYKSGYEEFAMSNSEDSYYTPGSSTSDNPRVIHVNIERVAARIDFAIDGSSVVGDMREYAVKGNEANKVLLTHVRPFNVMQQPTYLIKRLTGAESETPQYLAEEDCPAIRYVTEPQTWLKTLTGKSEANLNLWYGGSRLPETNGEAWFTDQYKVHTGTGNAFTDGVSYDPIFNNTYYVIDYANENTAPIEECDEKVTTGVKLRAIFVPQKLYYFVDNTLMEETNITAGTTFYRYQPVHSENTYNDKNNLYFKTKADAEKYSEGHPTDLARITEYVNGICYYNAWLRHDRQFDENNETIGQNKMEFGIVRNNIYRLHVEFSGPGEAEWDTTTKVEGIKSYIYVKKWNYIEHPSIEI